MRGNPAGGQGGHGEKQRGSSEGEGIGAADFVNETVEESTGGECEERADRESQRGLQESLAQNERNGRSRWSTESQAYADLSRAARNGVGFHPVNAGHRGQQSNRTRRSEQHGSKAGQPERAVLFDQCGEGRDLHERKFTVARD